MMDVDDNASEISIGSVISLQSLDDNSPLNERQKTPKRKAKKNQSPYTTKQPSGMVAKQSGHNLWASAIRNGVTGLSTENTIGSNRWANTVKHVNKKSTKVSSDKKPGPFSRDEHILTSGKPAYKSQEDYYNEIIELRQVIKQLKDDNSILKTKVQRTTQENVLKDRQINDFLNPNKQPDEIRRTLTDRKADSSAVVASLKQKLHLMERNIKDKESELRKLKSDLKTTNLEELKIQCETYYQETQRLQSILSGMYYQAPGTRNMISRQSTASSRTGTPRGHYDTGRKEQVDHLLDENNRLQAENRGLRKDLLSAIEGTTKKGNKSPKDMKNVDYADMNRVQLLQKIKELENTLQESEEKAEKVKTKEDNICKSKNEGDQEEKEDMKSEIQKQRETISNLKEDRSHYRDEADRLRSELNEANKEIDNLKDEIKRLNEQISSTTQHIKTGKPNMKYQNGSLKKSISFKMDNDEKLLQEKKRNQAAKTLQKNWKRYNKEKLVKQQADLSTAATQLQSIFRAHAVRKNRVDELKAVEKEDVDYDTAITWLQSALRAHNVRQQYLKRSSTSNIQNEESLNKPVAKSRVLKKRSSSSYLTKLKSDPTTTSTTADVSTAVITGVKAENTKKHEILDDSDSDDGVVFGSKMNLKTKPNCQPKTTATTTTTTQNLSSSSPSSKKNQEERRTMFFGQPDNNMKAGAEKAFSPSQQDKQPFTKVEFEQESRKEDEKKSVFSWAKGKTKKSKEMTQLTSDQISATQSVWSQPPDSDEDDVIVTPKFSRRTPTKSASLLDELF